MLLPLDVLLQSSTPKATTSEHICNGACIFVELSGRLVLGEITRHTSVRKKGGCFPRFVGALMCLSPIRLAFWGRLWDGLVTSSVLFLFFFTATESSVQFGVRGRNIRWSLFQCGMWRLPMQSQVELIEKGVLDFHWFAFLIPLCSGIRGTVLSSLFS